MQRLSESYKMRMGKQNYKDHLVSGSLPIELMQNNNFYEHKQQLRSCKKHGQNPTAEQIRGCFICQVLMKKLNPPPLEDKKSSEQT